MTLVTLYFVFTTDKTTGDKSWCRNFGTMSDALNYIQYRLEMGRTEIYEIEVKTNQEVYSVK